MASLLSDVQELLSHLTSLEGGGGVNDMDGADLIRIIDILTRVRHCMALHDLQGVYTAPSCELPDGRTVEIVLVSLGVVEANVFLQRNNGGIKIQMDRINSRIRHTPEDGDEIDDCDESESWTPWAYGDEMLDEIMERFNIDHDLFYPLIDQLLVDGGVQLTGIYGSDEQASSHGSPPHSDISKSDNAKDVSRVD